MADAAQGMIQSGEMRQEQTLTPQQLQSLDILYAPVLELQQKINQELADNPVLEIVDHIPDSDDLPLPGSKEEKPELGSERDDIEDELAKIVKRSAGLLNVEISEDGAYEIARRSRGTPRIANRILKRVRDYSEVLGKKVIDAQVADHALGKMEIDKLGLDSIDRKLILTIIDKFNGGPVGLDTLAASIGEDAGTIEDVYEPYLMQITFIARTPRGRICLPDAYKHFGRKATVLAYEQLSMLEEDDK